jgi:hypothetical protein
MNIPWLNIIILILLKTKCTHSQKYQRDFYRDYRERRQDGIQGQNNEEENQPVPILIKGKLVLSIRDNMQNNGADR